MRPRSVFNWAISTTFAVVLFAVLVGRVWPVLGSGESLEGIAMLLGWTSAAVAAATLVASMFAGDRSRLDRTVSISPNGSEAFLKAWRILKSEFPDLREKWPNNYRCDPEQLTSQNYPERYDEFLVVLNAWGRIATLHQHGALDNYIARKMYRYGFMRFADYFWPLIEKQPSQYADTEKLRDMWRV